jgi:hypothetical protein
MSQERGCLGIDAINKVGSDLMREVDRIEDPSIRLELEHLPGTLIVAMHALRVASGMSFKEMYDRGGLGTALFLYNTWVEKWDGFCDEGDLGKADYEADHHRVMGMISDPELKIKVEEATRNYEKAESKLCNREDLENGLGYGEAFFEVVRLKEVGFGGMARVLTQIIYAKDWKSEECRRVGDAMADFAIATGILDDLRDMEEDEVGGHVTIALLGRDVDKCCRGQEIGTTALSVARCLIDRMGSVELKMIATNLFQVALDQEKGKKS